MSKKFLSDVVDVPKRPENRVELYFFAKDFEASEKE